MTKIDLNIVGNWYGDALKKHGAIPQSVGWKDPSAQKLRFEKLFTMLPPPNANRNPFSIAELGCGYGAAVNYLKEKHYNFTYQGIDICPEMIEEAQQIHTEENAQFNLGHQISAPVDYCFESGVFHTPFENDKNLWEDHIIETLDNMHAMSNKAFAFNMITTYVDYKEDQLYYADPTRYFSLCKEKYSKYVTLLHDYPLYEFTIIVRKNHE